VGGGSHPVKTGTSQQPEVMSPRQLDDVWMFYDSLVADRRRCVKQFCDETPRSFCPRPSSRKRSLNVIFRTSLAVV